MTYKAIKCPGLDSNQHTLLEISNWNLRSIVGSNMAAKFPKIREIAALLAIGFALTA